MRYIQGSSTRDLRIDFLRGMVFLLLFTAHFNYFSWFALIAWERIGVMSSAEVFILLAGVVTGAVYGKKLRTEGLPACTIKLFKRCWTLYKIAVIVAGSVALLRLVPGIDASVLTHFTDPVSGQTYSLYPPVEAGLFVTLLHVLVLAAAPHQFQIVGLYVALFLFTPLLFRALYHGKTGWLLAASWLLYFVNYVTPESIPGTAAIRLTVCQFEYGFPILAWQLLFVHGVAAGYHRRTIDAFFRTPAGHMVVAACIAASLLLMLFSLNHPLPELPDWATMHLIAPETFQSLYQDYFLKYKLGPGRVLNTAVLMVSLMCLLTLAWRPIDKALGWLFIPLGQESMYVFFVHVYLLLIVSNSPLPGMHDPWVNTLIHALALLICWVMVKNRFLFRWIPR
ncbi:OpgC domain-containing protein [Noviherbaspirillum galbum]|uniref:Succinyl transferase OpgC n=1 Tax=Noviherbaspirillum galbum TaxID=2709383 RepID=A0A6B3STG1_9BURK|nr:OpgC domain-containing protein [Noviherbaspirillum galbum]NEX63921.1 succinyl transferase OpgC [Noviherbaspirillum galbum]